MNRFLTLVMTVVLLLPTTPIVSLADDAANDTVFYVSPDGDDNNPGTLAQPWKTIEKARDHIRSINDNMSGDIVVYLRGGTYYLDQTITFSEEDSGTNGYYVRYKAYPGETPVISGGRPVTGWVQDNENPNLYKADLDRDVKLRALYVNGERAFMTSKRLESKGEYGKYTVTEGAADWAWQSGETAAGTIFDATDLPVTTRNQSDIDVVDDHEVE